MTATEKHYTVQEIATQWQVSVKSVQRFFCDAPGVLKIGVKRLTLRIPASVLERCHEQRSRGFGPKVQRGR